MEPTPIRFVTAFFMMCRARLDHFGPTDHRPSRHIAQRARKYNRLQ